MAGYSCKRSSKRNNVAQVYGKWIIPTNAVSIFDANDYRNRVLPEMFFGFFGNSGSGCDIGILYVGNNRWKAFLTAEDIISEREVPTPNCPISDESFTLEPGSTVYADAWIDYINSSSCRINLRLSQESYQGPYVIAFSNVVNNYKMANDYASGYRVNREVSIAANETYKYTYRSTGTRIQNAKFEDHTLIFRDGTYAKWNDEESYDIERYEPYRLSSVYKYNNSGTSSVLELRSDDVNINSSDSHISATRSNSTSIGATETVTVRFDID